MPRPATSSLFDRGVPAVVVKVGRYPVHHGSVGAIRSLGRVGVPVYAIVEDPLTPAARSRYLQGDLVWPTTGAETEEVLVEGLARLGRKLPRRSVAIATDDEAAVVLAEHAAELEEWYLIPRVPPTLPRMLTSKRGLYELCHQHGIPTPAASFPSTVGEVASFAARASFPVVVKNVDPWVRLRKPAVSGTTIVATAEELRTRADGWPSPLNVLLQEYIPRNEAEDWIFHGYCDRESASLVAFTGVKLRSWPPHAGVTTYACSVPNAELADQAEGFFRLLGYQGVVDLDWRFDRRDGSYKLVDFNPRLGAQFRLFQNTAGIDVVRALHLDLTGREVPAHEPMVGRRLIVENLDVPARLAYRDERLPLAPASLRSLPTEFAWAVADDPAPLLAMTVRFGWMVMQRIVRTRVASWRRSLRSARTSSRGVLSMRGGRGQGGAVGTLAEAGSP
jgi:predicted ATP-grasp superfamily ATP-dependent carboligase